MEGLAYLLPLAQGTEAIVVLLFGLPGLLIGLGIGWGAMYLHRREAQRKCDEIIEKGKQESERIVKGASVEAKEQLLKIRAEFERETQETRQELRQLQRQLAKREDTIDRKAEVQLKKERYVEDLERHAAAIRAGQEVEYDEDELARLRRQKHLVESVPMSAVLGMLFRTFLPGILLLAGMLALCLLLAWLRGDL